MLWNTIFIFKRGQGGVLSRGLIVNFRFLESRNKKFTSVKFTKVTENIWSQCSEIQLRTQLQTFTNYFLSFHDSQPRTFAFHASRNTLQSRFKERIFIKSLFTEHKKTGSRRHENTLAPPLLRWPLRDFLPCITPPGSYCGYHETLTLTQ